MNNIDLVEIKFDVEFYNNMMEARRTWILDNINEDGFFLKFKTSKSFTFFLL